MGNPAEKAKDVTAMMKQASDVLQQWAESDPLGEKKLKALDDLLRVSKSLSKLSMGLGLLGAGLGLLSIFMEQKSDTDRILEAVGELSAKVDRLKQAMLEQFDNLRAHVELAAAKSQITQALDTLTALKALIDIYKDERKPQSEREDALTRLKEFRRKDVETSVVSIAAGATGASGHISVLATAYDATYGDLRVITQLGRALYGYLVFGLSADALLSSIAFDAEGKSEEAKLDALEAAARTSADYYRPLLDEAHKAWADADARCRSQFDSNWVRHAEARLFPRLPSSDHDAAAKSLVKQLAERWFWRDWLAIVYDPVGGWENHGTSMPNWFHRDLASGQANLIVAQCDRERPARGGSVDTSVAVTGPEVVTHRDPQTWVEIKQRTSYRGPAEDGVWSVTKDSRPFPMNDVRPLLGALIQKVPAAWIGNREAVGSVGSASTRPERSTLKQGKRFWVCLFE